MSYTHSLQELKAPAPVREMIAPKAARSGGARARDGTSTKGMWRLRDFVEGAVCGTDTRLFASCRLLCTGPGSRTPKKPTSGFFQSSPVK